MNLLFAADVVPDPNSGAAGTEYQTIEALRALGHDIDTIWADDLRHRIRHGNLHYLLELPWAYRDAIREFCARKEYDVIHVNHPCAWCAAQDHQRLGRPGVFVNRSHGWEPRIAEALKPWRKQFGEPEWRFPRGVLGRPMRKCFESYAKWCVQASDGIIVSCSEDQNYICSNYGVPANSVACIAQAPPDYFVEGSVTPMTTERLQRVLYVGQAGFFKGPHVLAKVFSRLTERNIETECTWCCPASSRAYCRSLLSPTARQRVKLLDWVSQEELTSLYDQNGIFIFTTLAEGFGKVFIEAMARGLCVVASNTAGMRDVIRDGETGRLIEPGHVDEFVDAIEMLRGRPEEAARMSIAAAATARKFSWGRVAKDTEQFYHQLLRAKAVGIGES